MILWSRFTLCLASIDARVLTEISVADIQINNSMLVYTDEMDWCHAILSAWTQPVSVKSGSEACYVSCIRVTRLVWSFFSVNI